MSIIRDRKKRGRKDVSATNKEFFNHLLRFKAPFLSKRSIFKDDIRGNTCATTKHAKN